jgi:hypothetical protein
MLTDRRLSADVDAPPSLFLSVSLSLSLSLTHTHTHTHTHTQTNILCEVGNQEEKLKTDGTELSGKERLSCEILIPWHKSVFAALIHSTVECVYNSLEFET